MDFHQLFNLLPKEPRRWTQSDVENWLEYIGLNELSQTFQRNAIDGACLEVLNEDDLNELGIASNVKRKKLLQWITQGLSEYKQFVRKNVGQNDWCIVSQQQINEKENNRLEYTPIQKLSEIRPQSHRQQQFLKDSFADNRVELVESMKVVEAPEIQQPKQQPKQESNRVLESTKLPSYPSSLKTAPQNYFEILELQSNKTTKVGEQGLTIGRNHDSGLVCSEDYVSRQHCAIQYDAKSKNFYLKDVGSSSGTFLLLTTQSLMRQGLVLHMGSMQYRIETVKATQSECDVILRVIEGDQRNQKFQFLLKKNQSCLKFGRHLQQFQNDTHLSTHHALFSYTDDGLIVEDMESRNGVWLRLSETQQPSERIKLTQDRQFRLGYEKIFVCQFP